MLKKFLIIFFLAVLTAGCAKQSDFVYLNSEPLKPDNQETVSSSDSAVSDRPEIKKAADSSEESSEPIKVEIPAKTDWPVAFASQAPFGNWDELHQEACEEASMIVAARYFSGRDLTPEIMEEEIQKLVAWEKERGYRIDLTAAEAADILEEYFEISAELTTEVTADRLKYELSQGRLVIVPAAGRELGNPYFRQPGPIYHMLVIRGYNGGEFITNDVGTKRGDGFRYHYHRLISAVHDWDHQRADGGMTEAEMNQGRPVVIIVGD